MGTFCGAAHLRRQAAEGEEVADSPVWEGHVGCGQVIEAPCRWPAHFRSFLMKEGEIDSTAKEVVS